MRYAIALIAYLAAASGAHAQSVPSKLEDPFPFVVLVGEDATHPEAFTQLNRMIEVCKDHAKKKVQREQHLTYSACIYDLSKGRAILLNEGGGGVFRSGVPDKTSIIWKK